MKLVAVAIGCLALLLTGCGGDDPGSTDTGADDAPAATSSPESPGEPSEPATEADQALPSGPFCDRVGDAASSFTGGGRAVDLAPGDPYPGGLGEASAATCFQQGGQGSVEVIVFAPGDRAGADAYADVRAGRLPLSVCNKPEITGGRFPDKTVGAACEAESSGTPLPAALHLMAPVGEGYLRCIAAAEPGSEMTPQLGSRAGTVCGRAMVNVLGS